MRAFRAPRPAPDYSFRQRQLWVRERTSRENLPPLLEGYRAGANPAPEDIASCLPGQTGKNDARAILKWSEILQGEDYYPRLVQLGRVFRELGVADHELMPCVAGFIGDPPAKPDPALGALPGGWKTPGMRETLASEFLRNLRWSGFKPDRHIVRLFDRWFPEVVQEQRKRAVELAGLLGTRRRTLIDFLANALTGVAVTPENHSYSEVDNLVWALGAYAERTGKESDKVYRLD